MNLGEIIRRRREELGLTQPELAEKAGISRPYVVQLERGYRLPSHRVMLRIFSALSLSLQIEESAEAVHDQMEDDDAVGSH
jgi:transcriptional regulator with XRE-family HTH domain